MDRWKLATQCRTDAMSVLRSGEKCSAGNEGRIRSDTGPHLARRLVGRIPVGESKAAVLTLSQAITAVGWQEQ